MMICEHWNKEPKRGIDHYYFYPDGTEAGYLCDACATSQGFCAICGAWVLGGDDDWPLDSYGCCAECLDDLKAETGAQDIHDADDWDFYPASWYDPNSGISEIEPEETPRGRYIGPVRGRGAMSDKSVSLRKD